MNLISIFKTLYWKFATHWILKTIYFIFFRNRGLRWICNLLFSLLFWIYISIYLQSIFFLIIIINLNVFFHLLLILDKHLILNKLFVLIINQLSLFIHISIQKIHIILKILRFIWKFLSSLSFDWCLLYLIILKINLIIFLHLQAFIVFRILRYLILSVAVYVVITKLIRPRAAKFTYNIVLSRNWRLACF